MPIISREMEELDLVNLERLAHILKGLSPSELETLEILLDKDARDIVFKSLKELNSGERIPLNEW
jgi:DNA replication protein DnaD